MFVVEIGSAFTTLLFIHAAGTGQGDAHPVFILAVALWLWFTVLFANFAEAMAEGRGKAQADTFRKARQDVIAKRLKRGVELRLADLKLDLVRREVFRGDQELRLTPIEYKLLVLFARHAGKVLTHRQILKEVWGPAYAAQTHYVRLHMAELRKKVEANPSRPKLLVTEPGVGYRLRDRT